MAFSRLLITAFIVFAAAPSMAAPPARPAAGIGVVAVGPRADDDPDVAIFQEPGVARVATLPPRLLPPLPSITGHVPGQDIAIVLDKQGEWMRITYDDAGRSGWILPIRPGTYQPWEDFLKGRPIKLLPGLKKNFYILHQEPTELRPGDVSVAGKELRVIQVQDDWCLVVAGGGSFGWLRWRDGDGRIAVSVGRTTEAQNN